jgi:hypothetical protein
MRTTLSLDEDLAAKLKAESQRSGRPFRVVVNDYLRRGLASRAPRAPARAFKVVPRDLGALRPGLALDSVADLIETLEGPLAR